MSVKSREATAKEANRQWLSEYENILSIFATLTFSCPVTKDNALRKGKCFGLNLNKSIFGNHFQRRDQGLVSCFVVEGKLKLENKIANPHLHYLIENHPKLTPELVRVIWTKTAGNKAAQNGVKIELIKSYRATMIYITKEIYSWEDGIQMYIPHT